MFVGENGVTSQKNVCVGANSQGVFSLFCTVFIRLNVSAFIESFAIQTQRLFEVGVYFKIIFS